MNNIIIYILFIINIVCFLLGYILAKLLISKNYITQTNYKNQKDNSKIKNCIQIDEKTVVLGIETDSLEKKYDHIGEVKNTEEKITESVNKLKNFKR
jgi:sortase (surface protein transpeptidase)